MNLLKKILIIFKIMESFMGQLILDDEIDYGQQKNISKIE